MEPITIIAIIAPVITGFGGIYFGHRLACHRIQKEMSAIDARELKTEKRHQEEKFENLIRYWGLIGNYSTGNKETPIYEKFYLLVCKERKDLYEWLKQNDLINETNDFIKWLSDKCGSGWHVKHLLEPEKN